MRLTADVDVDARLTDVDPEYSVWEQETDPEGSLTVQERLEPHETALIEVEQIL